MSIDPEMEVRRRANASDDLLTAFADHFTTELDWAIHYLQVHMEAEKPVYSDKTILPALMLLQRFAYIAAYTYRGASHLLWLPYEDDTQVRKATTERIGLGIANVEKSLNETLGPSYREFIGGLFGVDSRVLDRQRPQRPPPSDLS